MSSDNKDPRELLKASFSIVDRSLVDKDYKSTLSYPLEEQNVYRFFYQLTRITRDKGAIKHDGRLDALSGAVGY